jgi:hypothetical protein
MHQARHLTIGLALETVTEALALGWFTHCGSHVAGTSGQTSTDFEVH